MAYTNSVGIMPGAANEKLPFVHSDFKPRSKFAKCFGGFRKFPRQDNEREYEGQKLPLIHYSVADQRNLVSLGTTKHRNGRPEYPGFAGKKKLLKKKDNSGNAIHPAVSGSFTRNQSNAMKRYLSLPNLNTSQHQSEIGTFYGNGNSHERKHRHRHKDLGEIEFMKYLHRLKQQQQPQQHQQNNQSNNNHNMDTLFIVDGNEDGDDDDDDGDEDIMQSQINNTVVGNVVRFKDPGHRHSHHNKDVYNNYYSFQDEQELMNPFAKEVDKKLREARGKSGMKRDRRKDPDHMRILGDIVTAERMHELLLPRKVESSLNFEDSV